MEIVVETERGFFSVFAEDNETIGSVKTNIQEATGFEPSEQKWNVKNVYGNLLDLMTAVQMKGRTRKRTKSATPFFMRSWAYHMCRISKSVEESAEEATLQRPMTT